MSSHRKAKSAAQATGDTSQDMPEYNVQPTLFMFGDSSGNPSRSLRVFETERYFLVCTMVIDSLEMFRIDAILTQLKQKHFPDIDPSSVEFHGSALRRYLGSYTHNKHRANKKFLDICDDIVQIACSMNARINVVVLDKMSPDENYDHANIDRKAWTMAASMFREELSVAKELLVGIPVLDRYDAATAHTVSRALANVLGPFKSRYPDSKAIVMPSPLFVEASSSNLIQLVDMIAYIVARHYRRGSEMHFEKWYGLLESKIACIANLEP